MMATKEVIYKLSKLTVFLLWLPAYCFVIADSVEHHFTKYSFLLCCSFTAWEVHYGIFAFGTPCTPYTRALNIVYMLLDFLIAFCMVAYGNEATADWSLLVRVSVYIFLVSVGVYLLGRFANPQQDFYVEKRHNLIWLMVAFIPLFAQLEAFTLETRFVRWSALGSILGTGMTLKDFGNETANNIYKLSVFAGAASTVWYAHRFGW